MSKLNLAIERAIYLAGYLMESYLLDVNVASCGELWQRQPAMLMVHRQDVYAAWRLADESLADTINHHEELQKLVTAYAWVQ